MYEMNIEMKSSILFDHLSIKANVFSTNYIEYLN